MRKILIIILFSLFVLLNSGCKSTDVDIIDQGNEFYIVGTWSVNYNDGTGQQTRGFIFNGTRTEGSVTIRNIDTTGNYTVVDGDINFTIIYNDILPTYQENYNGVVVGTNAMSGIV